MANMEFLNQNYFNTTSMCYVDNGTTTVKNMFDRSLSTKFQSEGDDSDATTTTIRIDFSSPQSMSRIVLQDMNFKGFRLYYNSNTANTITPLNAETSTSIWSTNSETSMYIMFTTITSVDSVFIEATTTMVANEEKELKQFWINEKQLVLPDNPDAKGYKPLKKPKQFVHKMSDGGSAVYTVDNKFDAGIRLDYISSDTSESIESLHDSWSPFVFTPFPTGSSWDGKKIYEVNYIGNFDFDNYQDNYKGNGYKGKIKMAETPK